VDHGKDHIALVVNGGLLIDAAYSKREGSVLRAANLKLEYQRRLIRLAKDLQAINFKLCYCSRLKSYGIITQSWCGYAIKKKGKRRHMMKKIIERPKGKSNRDCGWVGSIRL
jgi:hypothetical protein